MGSLAIAIVVILAVAALVLSSRRAQPTRYVLVKGAEGFGDRMQCLLQALRYAKRTSRTVVVDWRDEHWCHDGGRTGFGEYFSLIGVRSASIGDLAIALGDVPTISSARWTPSAVAEPTRVADLYTYDEFSETPTNATCVVHPGVKFRAWQCGDASHLRARPWLSSRVARVFDGITGPYTAVHLRGGDRLARKVAETGISIAEYVASLRGQVARDEPVVLVSDDPRLVAEYTRQCVAENAPIPRVSGLTPPAECVASEAGTHIAKDLPCPWLTKRDLNANAVCDFVVLSHARRVVSDGASLFSQMAQCVSYPAFGIRTRK